jgi:hypothetical protein
MNKVEYVRELLKIDEHHDAANRLLDELEYHYREALSKIDRIKKELEGCQKETECSTSSQKMPTSSDLIG